MTVELVRQIRRINGGREPETLSMKYRAMRSSPFAILRVACRLFYARLPRRGVIK